MPIHISKPPIAVAIISIVGITGFTSARNLAPYDEIQFDPDEVNCDNELEEYQAHVQAGLNCAKTLDDAKECWEM